MVEKIVVKDATIRWFGKDLDKAFQKEMTKRVKMALVLLHNKTSIAVGKSTRTYGPSKSDEPPHKLDGQLQSRIFPRGPYIRGWGIYGDVGTSLDYGIIHELTGRSYLRTTAALQSAAIRKILTQQLGGKQKKGPGYRYSAAEIASARAMGAAGKTAAEISQATGMSQSHARNVVRGRTRTRGR